MKEIKEILEATDISKSERITELSKFIGEDKLEQESAKTKFKLLVTGISNEIMAESKELPISLENYLTDMTTDEEFTNDLIDNLIGYHVHRTLLKQLDKIADKLGIE